YTWYKLNEWMQVEILQIFGQSLETEPWYRFPYVQFMKVYFDVLFQESSIVQRKLGMKKAFGSMAFVTSLVPGIIMALFFAQIKLLARPLLSIPSSWGFGESYDEAQAVEQLVVLRPRDAPEVDWKKLDERITDIACPVAGLFTMKVPTFKVLTDICKIFAKDENMTAHGMKAMKPKPHEGLNAIDATKGLLLGRVEDWAVRRWQYVFVFPLDTDNDFWSAPAPEPNEMWERIFTRLDGTAEMTFKEGTTNKQFHEAVFDELVRILSGPQCGFEIKTFRTIDEDELFLLVSLRDPEAVKAIAEDEEFPAMLRHDSAYAKHTCPTDITTGRESFWLCDFGELLDGTRHTNRYPGYVRFTTSMDDLCEDFNAADRIRLARRRIRRFVRLQALLSEKVVNQFFCAHTWTDLQYFYKNKRWNDPCNLSQWPAEHLPDCIQQYFGADLSFFFHWFNAYTRFLLVPALLSTPMLLQDAFFKESIPDQVRWGESVAFSIFLGVWSTTFLARYKHLKNLKVLKWGMKHHDTGVAEVRRQFSDKYRDSWGEYCQQLFHWMLCAAFMAETVFVTLFAPLPHNPWTSIAEERMINKIDQF
ncbi:unnamed protein product, partial [Symbiodinium pilosum]